MKARIIAALVAAAVLAAGCGGGAEGDGSTVGDAAAGTGDPTGAAESFPPADGVEPASTSDPPADAGRAGTADAPPQPAAGSDPAADESTGEPPAAADTAGSAEPGTPIDAVGRGIDDGATGGRSAAGATDQPEPAEEPEPAADSGPMTEPEPTTEPEPVTDSGPTTEPEATAEPEPADKPGTTADRPGTTAGEPDPGGETGTTADKSGTTAGEPDAAGETGTTAGETGIDVEPAEVRGDVAFGDCGEAYLCATLAVPLDHDDPGGAAVELALGMIPAGDPSRRVGYLLVNPGGPGGGMAGFLDAGARLSPRLLERFDVIGWDPRGVGGSVPSGCREEAADLYLLDPLPDSPEERAALDTAARTLAEACVAGLGEAVGNVGTMDTVRDMDAIRRALGAETINYIGFSYGTLLGAHYAGMYGEQLRAAVLDGVMDPSLTSMESAVGQMVGFARTIDDMFNWCRTEPACAVTGDPAEIYDRLTRQLDAAPMRDSGGAVVLNSARANLAVVVASYSSDIWSFFFESLAAAAGGDGTMLGLLGEAYIGIADLGAFTTVNCSDGGAPAPADLDAMREVLDAVAGDFGAASLVSALPCAYWPVTDGTLPVGAVAAPEAPPILVIGNRGDNATPYEWAVSVAGQLASGVLVTYDGNEHTSYGASDCVDRVVDDYFIDLVVPDADVDCPAEN